MEVVTPVELAAASVDDSDPPSEVEEGAALAVVVVAEPALLLTAATNGLEELPPVPLVKSTLKLPIESCCGRFSLRLVESIEEPALMAQIQLLLVDVGSMLPPDHDIQPSQRILASIDPSDFE